MKERRRTEITFPAEIAKRGNSLCVPITKAFAEMMSLQEGDVIDVTLRIPKEDLTDE